MAATANQYLALLHLSALGGLLLILSVGSGPGSLDGRPVRVVYRVGDEGPEIILVSRRSPVLFALPKGKVDPGESLEQTAVREVLEETGLQARVVETLGEVRYWFTEASGERGELEQRRRCRVDRPGRHHPSYIGSRCNMSHRDPIH